MEFGPYSPLKAAHVENHKRMAALARNEVADPAQVHLVITNRCNHNCSFCAYRSSRSTCSKNFHVQDEIPWKRGEKLIWELAEAGTGAIQFTGGGEPTIHPHFEHFYHEALLFGMEVALVTNGSRLHKFDQDMLQQSAWIRVSLDACCPETHHQIRGTKDFYDVIRNITKLVQYRKPGGPIIGIGFVVSPDNLDEVGEAIDIAGAIGVDNIRISAAFYEGAAEEHAQYADIVEGLIEQKRGMYPELRVFDLFTDRLKDLEQQRPDYSYCPMARLVPYVAADQNVYSCCVMSYNDKGLIGSIKDQSFLDVWRRQGPEFFEKHDARHCDRCMFNEKNKFLTYMVKPAEHIEFI